MGVWRCLRSGPSAALVLIIHVYQCTVSRITPPTCRFQPTCSQYAVEAISRFGACRGLLLAAWRILRCNPWNQGGDDPVPPSQHPIPSCCGPTPHPRDNRRAD